MKKLFCLVLAIAMILGISATALADYKIGIMTGTVSQNEEEYRAAESELAKDPDHIITDTYPDAFMSEQETTISKLLAMAADPDVKAIVMVQGVPGAAPAFSKIRETRDDILLIVGVPQEDPLVISEVADVIMYQDEIRQADRIAEKLVEWGCDRLIHYSFPRHMAMELIVARHQLLEENLLALDIELEDRVAPDPTAEAGLAASQQFIFEDVPAVLAQYPDEKVAFFTTNCGMQVPLQTAVLGEANAYYPTPCCPSPYHGFPSSLSLELDVAAGNEAALKKVAEKLHETGSEGRFSTWPAPVVMACIEVGVAYAKDYIEGNITEKNDPEALKALMNAAMPGADINTYVNADGVEIDNFYIALLPSVDFADYLD